MDSMMQLKVAAMGKADTYSQPLPVISDMQYQLLFDSALLTCKEKEYQPLKIAEVPSGSHTEMRLLYQQ